MKEGPKLGDLEMEGQIMWVSENRMTKTSIKPKSNKWHPKTRKTVYHNVASFEGFYIEFDHHVRLKKTHTHTSEFDTASSL